MRQKLVDFIKLLTGAEEEEQLLVILCFLAVFLLLVSYYIVKPMRNSQFLKEFPPNFKPIFFLISVCFSLGFTKVFNYFFERMNIHRLLKFTFIIMMSCKLLFIFILNSGQQWGVTAFFFWASSYFLLCSAAVWGAINFLFKPEQSRRCFGFIAIGATLGAWLGAPSARLLISNDLKEYLLLVSAVVMFLTMLCMHHAAKLKIQIGKQGTNNHEDRLCEKSTTESVKIKSSLLKDVFSLLKQKYARCLAVMVFALAVSNTILDFQSDPIIDTQICKKNYMISFSELNTLLNGNLQDGLNNDGFEFVYRFKFQPKNKRNDYINKFLEKHSELESLNFEKLIKHLSLYKELNYKEMGVFYSTTYSYQNVIGLILLLCSRYIFKYLSIRFAVLLLPCFFLIAGYLLNFDIGLEVIQLLMVLSGSLNYSLNNVTKEILYTPTSPVTKGKYKAIIEGPVMRLGDFFAALLKLILIALFGQVLYVDFFLGIGLLIIILWLTSVWYISGVYQKSINDKVLS